MSQVLNFQYNITGLGGGFFNRQNRLTPHHHGSQLMLVRLGRGGGARRLPATHGGDAVCDRQHFLELMGNEYDRNAPLGELAHDAGTGLSRFLWGEHRGGLIQHQDTGMAIKRLDDLDALLYAYRNVFD